MQAPPSATSITNPSEHRDTLEWMGRDGTHAATLGTQEPAPDVSLRPRTRAFQVVGASPCARARTSRPRRRVCANMRGGRSEREHARLPTGGDRRFVHAHADVEVLCNRLGHPATVAHLSVHPRVAEVFEDSIRASSPRAESARSGHECCMPRQDVCFRGEPDREAGCQLRHEYLVGGSRW